MPSPPLLLKKLASRSRDGVVLQDNYKCLFCLYLTYSQFTKTFKVKKREQEMQILYVQVCYIYTGTCKILFVHYFAQ